MEGAVPGTTIPPCQGLFRRGRDTELTNMGTAHRCDESPDRVDESGRSKTELTNHERQKPPKV
eukprot:3885857-Rhodomonas_salina.1